MSPGGMGGRLAVANAFLILLFASPCSAQEPVQGSAPVDPVVLPVNGTSITAPVPTLAEPIPGVDMPAPGPEIILAPPPADAIVTPQQLTEAKALVSEVLRDAGGYIPVCDTDKLMVGARSPLGCCCCPSTLHPPSQSCLFPAETSSP